MHPGRMHRNSSGLNPTMTRIDPHKDLLANRTLVAWLTGFSFLTMVVFACLFLFVNSEYWKMLIPLMIATGQGFRKYLALKPNS